MKVAIVSTSDATGGAAIACQRLATALFEQGVDVSLVVKEKKTRLPFTVSANPNWLSQKMGFARFALEKLFFLLQERSKEVIFQFSTARFGQDISKMEGIRQADIIHLHWVNNGFLSLKNLRQLFRLGKPVVWTLHDMWAFTGGCHYSDDCRGYEQHCGNCPFLKESSKKDLSNKIFHRKIDLYASAKLHITTSSDWLKREAQKSALFSKTAIDHIPMPIDNQVFMPGLKRRQANRSSYNLLFQAMNINDERKGFGYLLESLEILKDRYPGFARKVKLLVFGKDKSGSLAKVPFETEYLGFLSGEKAIAEAFHKADLFIIPSLQDNLPNTVLESMACGVPVVGFATGGIPEMVDHRKNGFIAPKRDVEELAEGIHWCFENPKRWKQLAENAREKMLRQYSNELIAKRFIDLYRELLS